MPSKEYQLIIFDCDGTLVDSEPLTNRVISELMKDYGIHLTPVECHDRFAGKNIMVITDFISQTKSDLDVVLFEEKYRQRSKEIFNDELQSIPGAKELISDLDIPFCVASNGPKKKMKITLPAVGLDQFFTESNTFSAYDIKAWKPKPDLFLHACEEMNTHPSKALVIEDTWSGVMGAINANIDVWAYNPHGDKRLYLDQVPNFTKFYDIQHLLTTESHM